MSIFDVGKFETKSIFPLVNKKKNVTGREEQLKNHQFYF